MIQLFGCMEVLNTGSIRYKLFHGAKVLLFFQFCNIQVTFFIKKV